MRYKGETTEFERRGDGVDEPDWDSLSARIKRRANNTKQPHRYRGNCFILKFVLENSCMYLGQHPHAEIPAGLSSKCFPTPSVDSL